ncbi:MAG: hypothetical protein WC314_10090 [Vulcanimicrobiota bacterium]
MTEEQKNVATSNGIMGLGLGVGLFLGGLFLSIWTWGFGAAIGLPMMILGLFMPFLMATKTNEGRSWDDTRPREGAVRP